MSGYYRGELWRFIFALAVLFGVIGALAACIEHDWSKALGHLNRAIIGAAALGLSRDLDALERHLRLPSKPWAKGTVKRDA